MRSLAKNSIYNVLYRVISVLFPLIMISYASQVLQPQGIGRVSSAQNIAQYFEASCNQVVKTVVILFRIVKT